MRELPPIARFFAEGDALLERSEPTWWGAVKDDLMPAGYYVTARNDGRQAPRDEAARAAR